MDEPTILSTKVLFELQHELLNRFYIIEGLPKAPLAMQTKNGQRVARELHYRILEELYEMSEVFVAWANGGSSTDIPNEVPEELCDALHFYIELCIYIGIDHVLLDHVRRHETANAKTLSATYDSVTSYEIVFHPMFKLLYAGRYLKFKPWKQTPVTSDISMYRRRVLEVGVLLFELARFLRIPDDVLHDHFLGTYRKNYARLDKGV